jgi:hypothetical protein
VSHLLDAFRVDRPQRRRAEGGATATSTSSTNPRTIPTARKIPLAVQTRPSWGAACEKIPTRTASPYRAGRRVREQASACQRVLEPRPGRMEDGEQRDGQREHGDSGGDRPPRHQTRDRRHGPV